MEQGWNLHLKNGEAEIQWMTLMACHKSLVYTKTAQMERTQNVIGYFESKHYKHSHHPVGQYSPNQHRYNELLSYTTF